MQKIASVIKLKPGTTAEYKKRHDEIWPEMLAMIRRSNTRTFSIWHYEPANLLFTYMEFHEGGAVPFTEEERRVNRRWQEHMSDLIEHIVDPETGEDIALPLMFLCEAL